MKLMREVLLAIGVIFSGSWLTSTSFWLLSLPNDFAVVGGVVLLFLTAVMIGMNATRHFKMLKAHLERKPNA